MAIAEDVAAPVETTLVVEAVAVDAAPVVDAEKEDVKPVAKEEAPKADDISLIDGIGPVFKKKLESEGITTYAAIVALDAAAIDALEEKLELKGKFAAGEWVEQAKELMAGKPPRAKSDAARA